MLKKVLISSAAVVVGGAILFGSELFSYAHTACRNVREAVKSEITPEFELARIRTEIDHLLPEIRQHMTIVAEQSVDVRDLQQEIAAKETRLTRQREAILALRTDLTKPQDQFTYRRVSYTRGEVEADLEERFQAYRNGEDAINRDRKILAAQRQTLLANQKKLDSMLGRKQDLTVQVSELEARLKTIQASEAVHSLEFDDTHLAHVEDMIKNLDHALDVRESLLETEGAVLGRIPVEAEGSTQSQDIMSEIDEHFGLEAEQKQSDSLPQDSI